MIIFIVHSLELTLVGLLGYLGYVVFSLFSEENRSGRPVRSTQENKTLPYSRAESIANAQIFAGLQLLDIKRKGINLFSQRKDWIDSGMSYYLMGAASAITDHFECFGDDKNDVIKFLLTKNLQLTEEKAENYIHHIGHAEAQTIEKGAFQAGINAAKTWLTNKFIPEEQSLLTNLYSWGFPGLVPKTGVDQATSSQHFPICTTSRPTGCSL